MRILIKSLQKKIPVDRRIIRRAILDVLSTLSGVKSGEINVSIITDPRIKKLNERFHDSDFPTDVLAFDLSSGKKELIADIYISADTAVKNSRVFKTDKTAELYLYVIHGMLHIVGYDDHRPKDIKQMREKEQFFLKRLLRN